MLKSYVTLHPGKGGGPGGGIDDDIDITSTWPGVGKKSSIPQSSNHDRAKDVNHPGSAK